MPYDDYKTLRIMTEEGVAHLTIDNPPVNMLDTALITELKRFADQVRADDSVRVIVAGSANDDFFIAHVDLGFMLHPETFADLASVAEEGSPLNPMQSLNAQFRSLPQVTIAKLAGRLRGGGNEFAMAFDMRFAAIGRAWFSQPETRMGIIPGGGGTQLLTGLVGRARALEVILGGDLYDAQTAEKYGWVNLALPADQLDAHVDVYARRVAALRPEQITAAKRAVDAALTAPSLTDGLAQEGAALAAVYPAPEYVVDRMRAAVEGGIQTREGELDLEASLTRLSAAS
jgi:enoyl-CoA hydratase/carnithine racemase